MKKGDIREKLLKSDAPGGAGRSEENLAAWSYRAEKNSDSYRYRASTRKTIDLPDTGGPVKLKSTD